MRPVLRGVALTVAIVAAYALGALVLMLLAPAIAQAQVDDDLPLRVEDKNTRQHPQVAIVVSVPRELVGIEIGPEAFTVTENGAVVPVAVDAVPSDDLEVVLVLDVSGSMAGDPLAAAQLAALNFIEQMPPGVSMAVVTFADDPAVVSTFTTDGEITSAAVLSLEASGETALYDGLVLATEQFEPGSGARRTVILLSDGGDTVSQETLEQGLVALLANSVSLYAIELQTIENDPVALSRLAAATGGAVVPASDPDALEGIFEEIAAQLTNQYLLTYQSESFGPTAVTVAVEVDGATASATETLRFPAAPEVLPEIESDVAAPEPVAEPSVPAVRPGSFIELGFLRDQPAFFLAILLILAALGGLLWSSRVFAERQQSQLQPTLHRPRAGAPVLSTLADRAVAFADRSLQGEAGGRLNRRLEQAGVAMRPGEFVVLTTIAAIVGLAIGYILFDLLGGVIGAIVALGLVRLSLSRKSQKRKEAFGDQLTDALHLMAGSLRAGFGLLQAIEMTAAESPSPTAEEFQRVKVEVHLGRDVDEALHAMAVRVESEDFKWVTEGMQIHREVGGDIAEIIDSVNETVRSRNQVRRRIRALSAEGRISAVVLVILPIVLVVLISIINPDYVAELTGSPIGRLLIAFAAMAMVVGVFWIRRIVRLEF